MLQPELYFVSLITMLTLVLYFFQQGMVGYGRHKHNVKAPKTTGNDDFERIFRVHYNTLEQLPLFFIPLWLFALTVSSVWAGWLGLVWLLGRVGYTYGYYKSAEKRHNLVSVVSYAAGMALILGSFWGIISGLVG
jgi:glutathione S-transferase